MPIDDLVVRAIRAISGAFERIKNETIAAVATALWAVFLGVKSSAEPNRPQAGGYNAR
jgi:hypothetical protein